MRPWRLVLMMCAAEVLTMIGVFAFPALLPTFVHAWSLTNAEAGWIAGVYFAAYAAAAPVLLTLTDRIDARRIYIGGILLAAISALGFAWLATGFWTAMLFRGLAGAALAATYMPGLRVLVDRYRGPSPSRAVAFYTASFSLGTALSYFVIGWVAARAGWAAAFLAAGAALVPALAIALRLSACRPPPAAGGVAIPIRAVFRQVVGNRRAIAYILAYGAHCWELFTLRSWLVAFLVVAVGVHGAGGGGGILAPTAVATLSGLVAMVASIAGNELAVRFGRRRTIALAGLASAAGAAVLGHALAAPYPVLVGLVLLYAMAVQLDSAALIAGVVAAAPPPRRGATLALQALVGFGLAGIGPVIFGVVLDAAGGSGTAAAWIVAFTVVAAIALLVIPAVRLAAAD